MPNRIMRASALLATSFAIMASTLSAQEKAAPKPLVRTTASTAAQTAFNAALEEVTNFGGARADEKLKAVVDADPTFALGRALYANFTANLAAADRTRELEEALKAAASATAPEVLFVLALRESRAGRNPVARELIDVAMKQVPDEPTLAWFRVLIAANAEDALKAGEAATKRFPDYAPVHNTYAYRLNTAGRKEEAIEVVKRYVALAPNHPNSHDSYAEILALQGRYDEAAAHYQKALELDANWEVGHEGLAEVAVGRKHYAEARVHLQRAIALARTPARKLVLQREIASTYLFEGKVKEARVTMAQVAAEAEANSLNPLADKRTTGLLLILEGRAAEGTTQFTAAVPPNPGPAYPLQEAVFHAFLKHPAEVSKSLAKMEANAARTPDVMDTQEAMRAARVIDAVANGNMDAAASTLKQITTPVYRALAAAFVVQGARKSGNTALAADAVTVVDAYPAVNLNAGLARYLVHRK